MNRLPIQSEEKDYIQELNSNWFLYTRTGGCFGSGILIIAKRGHGQDRRRHLIDLSEWFKFKGIETSYICLHKQNPFSYWWFSIGMKASAVILADMKRLAGLKTISEFKVLLLEKVQGID